MTDPVHGEVLKGISTSTTVNAITLTTTEVWPVGHLIAVATNRSTTSTTTNGIASITVSGGATDGFVLGGSGVRTLVHDTRLSTARITTALPIGTNIVITMTNTSTARRAAIVTHFSEVLSSTVQATSGQTAAGLGDTSYGANGSSATASATGGTATTAANTITLMATSTGATTTASAGPGMTEVDQIATAVGTSDRGVMLSYRVNRSILTPTVTTTYAGTTSWAAATASYTITASAGGGSVIVGGVKKTVANRWVVVGGVKKSVVGTSVIVGGVKKSVL